MQLATELTIDDADRLAEAIQLHAAKSAQANCYLLVDPALRPLEDRPEKTLFFSKKERTVIGVNHRHFPKAQQPYLLQLNLDSFQDTRLLAESAHMALADRQPNSMLKGQGQRIGGWLLSSCSAKEIARHFAEQLLHRDAENKQCLLRFYDSRVLSLLWPLLNTEQRAQLLGGVGEWLTLNQAGQLQVYQAQPLADMTQLQLSVEQWHLIDTFGAVNNALAKHQQKTNLPLEQVDVDAATRAAARCHQYGITDNLDQQAFIGHALSWHPLFDRHPAVGNILQQVRNGMHYSAAIEALNPLEQADIRSGRWLDQTQGV